NYGVFDEKRGFAAGPMPGPVNFRGVRLGLPICEDILGEEVVECLVETGAEMLIVPNGSPHWRGKAAPRPHHAIKPTRRHQVPAVYVNQVGGTDERVFDGVSFGIDADRSLAFQLKGFEEEVVTTHWSRVSGGWRADKGRIVPDVGPDKADYTACVLGLRDY